MTRQPIAPASTDQSFTSLCQQLAEDIAAILEHPQCPNVLRNQLSTMFSEIFNSADQIKPGVTDLLSIRYLLGHCCAMLSEAEQKPARRRR